MINHRQANSIGREPITHLLRQIANGDLAVREQLFQIVYAELRRMARRTMRRERRSHTLQPTALVHEATARMLQGDALATLADRRALFGLAAQTMRRVLVDHGRRRAARKRPHGEGRRRLALDELFDQFESVEQIDILTLEDALEQLQSRSPRQHEIVVLHFYGGLRFAEIAEHLGVCLSTVEKNWKFARCWLLTKMEAD